MTIKYSPEMKIANIDSMSPGRGAKFLLCLVSHSGSYIAKEWKRKEPSKIPTGHVLVSF